MKSASLASRPFTAGLTLLVVCAMFFVVSAAADLPSLRYVPALGVWSFHPPARHIAMDWFWRAGVALVAGLLVAPIAHRFATRWPPGRLAGATRLVFGLAFGVLFWCAVYLAFALATTSRGHVPASHEEG